MRDEDLRRVVTEPLKLAGVAPSAREALARSVLQDVGERPGDLALVQFALTATWQHRNEYGGDLLQSYTGIGRAEGALARAAENATRTRTSSEGMPGKPRLRQFLYG
jgi:hypothetical protein